MSTTPLPKLRDAHGFTLIELMIVVVIIGILSAIAIPNYSRIQDLAKAASTKSACHTVQLVAEQYAATNNGFYPGSTADPLPVNGLTMIDMLPNGQRLTNAFTQVRSEPIDGAPGAAGQIGYQVIVRNGGNAGYVIEGHDQNGICLTVSNGI